MQQLDPLPTETIAVVVLFDGKVLLGQVVSI